MILWGIIALLVGGGQARWLWQDAVLPSWYGPLARYALVTALLIPAAISDHLLVAVLAWGTAFTAQCLWLYWRAGR